MAIIGLPPAVNNKALRDKLQRIARYHRWVITVIGVSVGFGVLSTALALVGRTPVALCSLTPSFFERIVGVVLFALFAFAAAATVLLAKELTNWIVAGICGVIVFVPYARLAFLPMLIVLHLLAMRRLRSYGIKLGLFGADPKRIGSVERQSRVAT